MKIHHALCLLVLSICSLGADGFGCGNPLDASAWPTGAASSGGDDCSFKPPWSLSCNCGWHMWACNVPSNLIPPPSGFTAPACGVLLCAASAMAAMDDAATNLLGGTVADYPALSCLDAGADIIAASSFDKSAFAGQCVAPRGKLPCVPLITWDMILNTPATALCDLVPTEPSRACCPSPQTGTPYLCRPLPAPNPSEVGKGLCAIDTLADSTSKCTDSVQCYPGACYPDTCFCAAVGEPCASTSACCDSPSAAAACTGGTCEWTN